MFKKFCDEKIAKLQKERRQIHAYMKSLSSDTGDFVADEENSFWFARCNLAIAIIDCKIALWKAVKK